MEITKLFIPGPTKVHPDVLKKMSVAPFGHRTKEATELQKRITEKMRELMYTRGKIVLSTSSGTGLMEGAIRGATAKRAIVFSVGAFGKRWHELAKLNGIEADLHHEKPGMPTLPETVNSYLSTGKYDVAAVTHSETSSGVMNPLHALSEVFSKYPNVLWLVDGVSSIGGIMTEVDKLGIDVCITSSQKCLALPPGLAMASVSKKAEERFHKIGSRGFYLDFKTLLDFIDKRDHQYSCTPSVSHMVALDFQLDRIMKEGLQQRFDRHTEMAEYMIEWATKYFKVFAAPGFESLTVTCVENTRNISVKDLNEALSKKGMLISNGYGDLKDKTFRIGHMGEFTLEDIMELTGTLEDILKLN